MFVMSAIRTWHMVTYRPDDPKMDYSILVFKTKAGVSNWPKSNLTVLVRDVKIGKRYVSNSASA